MFKQNKEKILFNNLYTKLKSRGDALLAGKTLFP